MKRLSKIQDPRMVSARIERADVEKFETLLSQQRQLTFQDFVAYSITQFISGTIYAEGRHFHMKESQVIND